MDRKTILWGGFEITYGSKEDKYRAHAVPRSKARGLGLTNISAEGATAGETLTAMYRLIVDAWKPFTEKDPDIQARLNKGSVTGHSAECHRCHHGVHSAYMPVCAACKRSICLNCGSCLCGYSGPIKSPT